ncbi:signal peptidase II [Aurantibacter aestuarii]|uniref:Lipoprotein signal peptidase n=1 Tax=Aurantibacter aestuarii TaxID=1266046 RepID=A0A2T1NFL8_9FLAO|nr:signal peptidase II [Aurantibacter aestuarii]PSG91582.1 signal peptidase II [Aurantibacter aestuarii]
MSKRTVYILSLIVINIALDQISKVIARATLMPYEEVKVLGSVFTLNNVENDGAFLGLGGDFHPFIKIALLWLLPILVLGFVLRMILTDKSIDAMSLFGFCCIVGGGVANVFDRIVYGSVTDFMHIDFGGSLRTGIFNIADVSVMVGLGCLLVASFRNKKKKTLSED